jgi:hypothetical protein
VRQIDLQIEQSYSLLWTVAALQVLRGRNFSAADA